MNLDLLTDGTPDTKPWANLQLNSINANTSNTKYGATATNPSWNGALAVVPTVTVGAVVAGVGGSLITYSPTRDEVIQSGLSGANTAGLTTAGVAWTQIVTPMSNPSIMWSPTLSLYSAVDGSGTAVYTSVDGVTYVIGTPFAPGFSIYSGFIWSTVFSKFINSSGDALNKICDSSDGKVYTSRASTRLVQGFAESVKLGRVVAVGDAGAQYTDDGKTWTPCAQVFSASAVAWSDTYSCFVTVPRNGTRRECWRSSDGITWTVTNAFGGGVNIRTIVWSQDMGLFIAGGDTAYLAFSIDGLTWRRANVAGAYASYGGTYIQPWGQYMLIGIGAFFVTNGKRFKNPV